MTIFTVSKITYKNEPVFFGPFYHPIQNMTVGRSLVRVVRLTKPAKSLIILGNEVQFMSSKKCFCFPNQSKVLLAEC